MVEFSDSVIVNGGDDGVKAQTYSEPLLFGCRQHFEARVGHNIIFNTHLAYQQENENAHQINYNVWLLHTSTCFTIIITITVTTFI